MYKNEFNSFHRMAINLLREIRGQEEYDPKLKEKVVEAKALEGMAESGTQLCLQSYLVTYALTKGTRLIYGVEFHEYFKSCK